MSNPNVYWASKPADEIGQELMTRLDENRKAMETSTIAALQRHAFSFFFDAAVSYQGQSSAFTIRGGDQGELAQLRVNNARQLLVALVQIICSPSISWSASSLNNDPESTSASITGAAILENVWKTRGVNQKAQECMEQALWAGASFLFTPWDTSLGSIVAVQGGRPVMSGDVAFHKVSPWHVVLDANARSYDECQWAAVRLFQNKYDLAARYPKAAEKILAMGGSGFRTEDEFESPDVRALDSGARPASDLLPVWYWMHDRTPALPRGRMTILAAADVVLEDGPMKYWRRPLHRFSAGNFSGTPWAYTSWWGTLGPQEIADSISTSLATNASTFGSPIISAVVGTDLPIDQLAGGPTVIYRKRDDSPPVPINFAPAPDGHLKHLQWLQSSQRQVVGLNDVALGTPQSAQMNAQAFSLLYSAALQQNSGLQRAWVEAVRSVGQSVVETYREFCPEARQIAIVGDGAKNLLQPSISFKGDDLKPIDQVVCEIGNAMSQSAAGRLQLAQLFAQSGFASTPEQLTQVLDTGKLEAQTQAHRNQYLVIAYENKELRGGNAVPVHWTDNHQLHAMEHAAEAAKPEVRTNAKAMGVLNDHIRGHHDALYNTDPSLLALVGVQPPPAPPPPAGQAGPPGADGGASAMLQEPAPGAPPSLEIPPNHTPGAPDPASVLGQLPGVISSKE
jgi:hypothetical protein